MALIPTLVAFSPGTVILSADVNSNNTAIRDAFNGTAVLTDVAKTITVSHTISADPGLILTAAVSRIVGGATSFAIRNAANSLDNILVTDAGAVTFRSTVGGITTLTATTLAGTLSTAAQPNVTSLGTLTSLVLSGAISGVTTLTATTLAGTLSTAAQPNITSVGALSATTLSEGSRRAVTRIGAVTTNVGTGAATVETTLHTVTVPAGVMGANGAIRITVHFKIDMTGASTVGTLRVKFGGTAFVGVQANIGSAALSDGGYVQILITNRGATNSQFGRAITNATNNITIVGYSGVTAALDTTAALDVTVTGETADATGEVTAQYTLVELIPG